MYVEAIVVIARDKNHIRITRALRPLFFFDSFYLGGTRRSVYNMVELLIQGGIYFLSYFMNL